MVPDMDICVADDISKKEFKRNSEEKKTEGFLETTLHWQIERVTKDERESSIMDMTERPWLESCKSKVDNCSKIPNSCYQIMKYLIHKTSISQKGFATHRVCKLLAQKLKNNIRGTIIKYAFMYIGYWVENMDTILQKTGRNIYATEEFEKPTMI